MIVNYSTAFKALNRYIDQYNVRQKSRSQKLHWGAAATAKELIRIYGIALLEVGDQLTEPGARVPGLRTNNPELAKLVKCSARSIQRHIIRLEQAGIITGKIFHGTKANYELFINLDILLIKPQTAVENPDQRQKMASKTPVQNALWAQDSVPKATNWRHTYTRNIYNNIITAVDNSKIQPPVKPLRLAKAAGNMAGNAGEVVQAGDMTGNAGEIARKKFIEAQKKIIPRAAAQNSDPLIDNDPARAGLLALYSDLFWVAARELLYDNVALSQRQVDIARQFIYRYYESVPTAQLAELHGQHIERLNLVSKYLRRDPRRFVMLPYFYFDINNPNGFAGTKRWYEANLKNTKPRGITAMTKKNKNA